MYTEFYKSRKNSPLLEIPNCENKKEKKIMDPCPFARLIVESLALKLPTTGRSSAGSSGVHPTTSPCYCKISFKGFPSESSPLPLISGDGTGSAAPTESSGSVAEFLLDAAAVQRISVSASSAVVRVSVYGGRMAACGGGKAIGSVEVKVDLRGAEAQETVYQSGWISLGGRAASAARIHVVVRSEPDPRFVFQFGGEPECSPVVYQVQGKCNGIRQPVFSCKFTPDRNTRSRSLPCGMEVKQRGWIRRTLSGEREKRGWRDRKGWMAMIYDLSGSAVAAASIITPFVASPGTDSVSRSNPGAWLILRPSASASSGLDSWKPWGRLEAWRERWGPAHGLGYRFLLVTDDDAGPVIAEGSVSAKAGGEFRIRGPAGFVMASTLDGEGKESRPIVTIAAHHVTCMPDVALFVALAAALDLSMDACRLFSRRLRKELCSSSDHHQTHD